MFIFGRQDDARVQKVTKRVHTLEEVSINVKLLAEMLSHYDQECSTDSDREIIKVHTHNILIVYLHFTVCTGCLCNMSC